MQRRCDDVAELLPSILDGGPGGSAEVVGHVEQCLRCQAELARYHKLLRLLRQLNVYRVEPPAGIVAEVLGELERAANRRAIRSALTGRRVACAGALVAASSAAVAVVLARGRLARATPFVAGRAAALGNASAGGRCDSAIVSVDPG